MWFPCLASRNATAVAIAQCREGNPERAIPVLEQKTHRS
jgi:hypothetical protein